MGSRTWAIAAMLPVALDDDNQYAYSAAWLGSMEESGSCYFWVAEQWS